VAGKKLTRRLVATLFFTKHALIAIALEMLALAKCHGILRELATAVRPNLVSHLPFHA
jgi:hypothetical protein